jgi:hypothetical protein
MNVLNESNFMLYAAANYVNSVCYDTEEFYDDLKRFKYLKRLFSRYYDKNVLKERLILNHLITLYNVFEHSATTRMLFYKIDRKHWPILKTFLLFLGYMPDVIYNIEEKDQNIISVDIPIDIKITSVLRKI